MKNRAGAGDDALFRCEPSGLLSRAIENVSSYHGLTSHKYTRFCERSARVKDKVEFDWRRHNESRNLSGWRVQASNCAITPSLFLMLTLE
jgi:hypothetical protein